MPVTGRDRYKHKTPFGMRVDSFIIPPPPPPRPKVIPPKELYLNDTLRTPRTFRNPAEALNAAFNKHTLPMLRTYNRYCFGSTLGEGTYGNVRRAKRLVIDEPRHHTIGTLMEKTKGHELENVKSKKYKVVAIKSFKLTCQDNMEYNKNKEVIFIKKMPYHPNLIRVHDIFISQETRKLHITMESMETSLHDYIHDSTSKSEKIIRSILAQLLNAIRHIHKNGFIHCDIKPANVLLMSSKDYYGPNRTITPDKYVAKLTDFGLSQCVTNGPATDKLAGTEGYRAPEILLQADSYSKPVDIFAFGALAYEFITGEFAFMNDSNSELKSKSSDKYKVQLMDMVNLLGTPSKANNLPESYEPQYGYWSKGCRMFMDNGLDPCLDTPSQDLGMTLKGEQWAELRQVIQACLRWNPNQRPTADELCRLPFFKGTCVDN